MLANMYKEGRGVEQSYLRARDFYQKACQNGLRQGCDAHESLMQLELEK
jgi:TPR repeat protein